MDFPLLASDFPFFPCILGLSSASFHLLDQTLVLVSFGVILPTKHIL